MLKKFLLSTILLGSLLANIGFALAQSDNDNNTTASGTGLIPKATGEISSQKCIDNAPQGVDPKTYCGDYGLQDFISMGIIASNWILGIVGSLSLVMFIYGGFLFLISSGSSDKIGQATKIITASIIGLIIVFSSYLIIKFVIQGIGADPQYQINGVQAEIK